MCARFRASFLIKRLSSESRLALETLEISEVTDSATDLDMLAVGLCERVGGGLLRRVNAFVPGGAVAALFEVVMFEEVRGCELGSQILDDSRPPVTVAGGIDAVCRSVTSCFVLPPGTDLILGSSLSGTGVDEACV